MSTRIEIPPGMGQPIPGPTALGNDPRRLWRLAWTLALSEFKLRFFGSVLGYLWQVMRPLMLFGVLYFVFSVALDLGDEVAYFPAALLLGIVLHTFLNDCTSQGVRALVSREPLVRKVEFPRLAVPLSTTITACLNLGLNLIPVLVFLVAAGWTPHSSMWLAPFLLVSLALFCFGLSMLLSALFVRFRDIEPIWDVILQIMFYASPIFYPINLIIDEKSLPTWVADLMLSNPFSAVLQQLRHSLIDPVTHYSTAGAMMGSPLKVLVPIGIGLGTLLLGYYVFSREAPRVAEDL